MTEFTFNSTITDPVRGIPTFTLQVPDGDATGSAYAEQDYIIVDSSSSVRRVYVLCDNVGTTGNVIVEGDSTGASTLPAAIANLGTCIAFNYNVSTANQAILLNKLRSAIISNNGHGTLFTASSALTAADGPQEISFEEPAGYYDQGLHVTLGFASTDDITLIGPSQGNSNIQWEGLLDTIDDNDANAAVLQARMDTADTNPAGGFDIANNTEYNDKFIPTITSYKKKLK